MGAVRRKSVKKKHCRKEIIKQKEEYRTTKKSVNITKQGEKKEDKQEAIRRKREETRLVKMSQNQQ